MAKTHMRHSINPHVSHGTHTTSDTHIMYTHYTQFYNDKTMKHGINPHIVAKSSMRAFQGLKKLLVKQKPPVGSEDPECTLMRHEGAEINA